MLGRETSQRLRILEYRVSNCNRQLAVQTLPTSTHATIF